MSLSPSFTAIPNNRKPADPAPRLMARCAPLQKDKHIAAFNTAQALPASMLRSSFPVQTHSGATSVNSLVCTDISNEKRGWFTGTRERTAQNQAKTGSL